MPVTLLKYDNYLVIPKMNQQARFLFIFRWVFVLGIVIISWFTPLWVKLMIWLLVFSIIKTGWNYFRFPHDFNSINIRKFGTTLYVGKQEFDMNELLFLSFREDEQYRLIRLEAKRNAWMMPKESVLITHCGSFEEALALCREIRNFINPDLLINHIRIGYGKQKVDTLYESGSREGLTFDVWEYVE